MPQALQLFSKEIILDYTDLTVWQKSMDLVAEVYKIVKKLPKEELFALSNQMRRAVVSIPSNIAEGFGRASTKDYLHFLTIARGSVYETETQLRLCVIIGYISEKDIEPISEMLKEIKSMLNSMVGKMMKQP